LELSSYRWFQLKTDWKARSDAHKRTLDLYAEVKREAGYLLASNSTDENEVRRVISRYDMASAVAIEIPEKYFLRLKRSHRVKVLLSKHLDLYPASSLSLMRIKLWLEHNRFRRSGDGS
jgi:hypothetical protein